MAITAQAILSPFAQAVLDGLSQPVKSIPARYFYDDLGSALFEAITLLPEYGLTRADERLLQTHAPGLADIVGSVSLVCELGSGSGKKTRAILEALGKRSVEMTYSPIDVSAAALAVCERELHGLANVHTVCDDWMNGLVRIAAQRTERPLLLLFLGSSIGNLSREQLPAFLKQIRSQLRQGDFFLLGADLVKDIDMMLSAYDDPTCVTAAFNLNLLGRMNRELGADFDLRAFAHEARWNEKERRIEMHLLSGRDQSVFIPALGKEFRFEAGETIWTESSHKFCAAELLDLSAGAGFDSRAMWIDNDWPFAECLWQAV